MEGKLFACAHRDPSVHWRHRTLQPCLRWRAPALLSRLLKSRAI